jgi:hypothetical protein
MRERKRERERIGAEARVTLVALHFLARHCTPDPSVEVERYLGGGSFDG